MSVGASRVATRYLLTAAALQMIWGLVPSASKYVIDEIPVELYIAIRWTLSSAILAAYIFITKGWRPISPSAFIKVSLLGVLGYGAASFGTLYGLKVGGVTNFALLGAMGPIVTSAVSIFILREQPARLFYLGLVIGVIGLVTLLIGKYQISSLPIAGLSAALIISGCVFEAFAFVFSKKLKSQVSNLQYLAIAQAAAAILMWVLQLSTFHQFSQVVRLTAIGLGCALFVSLIACVLCYVILYWLLGHMDGHRLALFDNIHTLSATTFGVIFFHEPLRPLMLLGGSLILCGLTLGNWSFKDEILASNPDHSL